jgi:hypothetical protein
METPLGRVQRKNTVILKLRLSIGPATIMILGVILIQVEYFKRILILNRKKMIEKLIEIIGD